MDACILGRAQKALIAEEQAGSAGDELTAGDEKVTRTAGSGTINVVDARSQVWSPTTFSL